MSEHCLLREISFYIQFCSGTTPAQGLAPEKLLYLLHIFRVNVHMYMFAPARTDVLCTARVCCVSQAEIMTMMTVAGPTGARGAEW